VPPRLRKTTVAIVVVATVAVLAGATYQGVATSLERHRFLRPGGLVESGSYQLHIYCLGTGSPTVVLEAPAGSVSTAWGAVQPEIARVTRVCSYDRAGLGWSEGDGRYDPWRVPANLRTLLDHAGEHGPRVIVGHELGADFARLYAAGDPTHTAAIVLIDDPTDRPTEAQHSLMVAAWPWLARVGLLRATGRLEAQTRGLPGDAGGAMRAFLNRPDHLTQAAREIARIEEVTVAARSAKIAPSIVVTSVVTDSTGVPAALITSEQVQIVTRAIEETLSRVSSRRAGP